jgi:hypothetical protein
LNLDSITTVADKIQEKTIAIAVLKNNNARPDLVSTAQLR